MKTRQSPGIRDLRIGRDLGLRRRASGRTQQEVADAVGVTWQQISKYERGKDCISASRHEEIVEYLNVSPVTGFGETQTEYVPPPFEPQVDAELKQAVQELSAGLNRLLGVIDRRRA